MTTALTGTEPGRSQEQADQAKAVSSTAVPDRPVDVRLPYDTGGPDGVGTVRLTLDPGRSGGNTPRVFVTGRSDKPRDLPELKVSFTLDAQEIGPLPVELNRTGPGSGRPRLPNCPCRRLGASVTVRTSDIDQTTIDKNVKIG